MRSVVDGVVQSPSAWVQPPTLVCIRRQFQVRIPLSPRPIFRWLYYNGSLNASADDPAPLCKAFASVTAVPPCASSQRSFGKPYRCRDTGLFHLHHAACMCSVIHWRRPYVAKTRAVLVLHVLLSALSTHPRRLPRCPVAGSSRFSRASEVPPTRINHVRKKSDILKWRKVALNSLQAIA